MIKPTVKRRTASHSNRKRTDGAAQRPTRKTFKRKPTRQATTDQRRQYSAEQTESKKARIIAMLRAPSGATIEASAQRGGNRIPSADSLLASYVKSSASISCQQQQRAAAYIGLRTRAAKPIEPAA
jgi:hypothetical protein